MWKKCWQSFFIMVILGSILKFEVHRTIGTKYTNSKENTRQIKVLSILNEGQQISKVSKVWISYWAKGNQNYRVWSWLRTNAGGVLKTCKSNGQVGVAIQRLVSGKRVSNAWVICLIQGDNSWKRLLIPHKTTVSWGYRGKRDNWYKMSLRFIS